MQVAAALAESLVRKDAWELIALLLAACVSAVGLEAGAAVAAGGEPEDGAAVPVGPPQAPALEAAGGTPRTTERSRHGFRLPIAAAVSLSVALLKELGCTASRGSLQAAAGLQGAVAVLLPAALAALSPAGAAGANLQRVAVRELVPALVAASAALGDEPLAATLRAIWGACR